MGSSPSSIPPSWHARNATRGIHVWPWTSCIAGRRRCARCSRLDDSHTARALKSAQRHGQDRAGYPVLAEQQKPLDLRLDLTDKSWGAECAKAERPPLQCLYVFGKFGLAERGGFEPPVQLLTVRRFSKPLLSTTQPPLREMRSCSQKWYHSAPPPAGRVSDFPHSLRRRRIQLPEY